MLNHTQLGGVPPWAPKVMADEARRVTPWLRKASGAKALVNQGASSLHAPAVLTVTAFVRNALNHTQFGAEPPWPPKVIEKEAHPVTPWLCKASGANALVNQGASPLHAPAVLTVTVFVRNALNHTRFGAEHLGRPR